MTSELIYLLVNLSGMANDYARLLSKEQIPLTVNKRHLFKLVLRARARNKA
jgi:hypothetical protein